MRQAPATRLIDVMLFGKTAFERTLQPHLTGLRRLALRLTGNRDDAEELLQDVLAQLYTRTDVLLTVDEPGSWLRRVVYRRFVDHWRRRQADPVDYSADDPGASAMAATDAPDEVFERLLGQRRLQRTLDKLSEDHRSVLLMHDVEGYTLPEIAQILAVSEGTLKSRLHRARHNLRERLLAGTDGTNPAARS